MIGLFTPSWVRAFTIVAIALGLSGCAVLRDFQPSVSIQPIAPHAFIAQQRGDILTSGKLSARTVQSIQVTGLDLHACTVTSSSSCLTALVTAPGISDERRFSALAELWLKRAITVSQSPGALLNPEVSFDSWMEVTRYAYAYLFFTPRSPGERAFENRQTQVRDWYNYSVQQAVSLLFDVRSEGETFADSSHAGARVGAWTLHVEINARMPKGARMPQELLPASSLSFQGVRSVYRRDGFGAELVAVLDTQPLETIASVEQAVASELRGRRHKHVLPPAWSEMPSPNLTVLFRFDSDSLEALLRTREVSVSVHDPLLESEIMLHGGRVPLAGNYTAGYGVWLARSGFNEQSLRSLLGRDHGIERPHLYMMQPFDPDRRVIVMLHGLASSPEAWVNLANEIIGDEELRQEFQVWQIYYPTNMPIALNHAAVRSLLTDVLRSVDPAGEAAASQGLVLVGHSMGGMITRLLVSSADEQLWEWALSVRDTDADRLARGRKRIDPILRFQPFPGVGRAIFIATPHRGTAVAGDRLARWVSGLIRLPATVLETLGEALPPAQGGAVTAAQFMDAIPNSIDNLDQADSFVKATARLPLAEHVHYHSIIARLDAEGPLAETDDGLVPYTSAHLPGAVSEKVIVSGHSVQETAAAILEIRRILHEDIAQNR